MITHNYLKDIRKFNVDILKYISTDKLSKKKVYFYVLKSNIQNYRISLYVNFVTFLIMINFFNFQIKYIYAFIYSHFVCNSCLDRFIFIYKTNVRKTSQNGYRSSTWYTWVIRNFITHYIYIISAGRNSLYQHTAVRTGIFLRRRNVRNERSG